MTKKLMKLKLSAAIALLLVVGLVAVATGVKAFGGLSFWDKVAQVAGEKLANKVEMPSTSSEPELGALTSPDIESQYLCVNGYCSFNMNLSFADATTTIVSIKDPFLKATSTGVTGQVILLDDGSGAMKWTGATSTIDLVRLDVTGAATTSFSIACGMSADPTGVQSTLVQKIVSTTPALPGSSIPTSTVGVLENNVTAAQGAAYDVGSVAKVMIGSDYPYFVCIVKGVNDSAFTNADNTFAGKALVRFNRAVR